MTVTERSQDEADREAARKLVGMLVGLRKELGVNKAELTRRTGLAKSTLERFETPGFDPYLSTLQRYARGLGVTMRMEVAK